MYRLLIVDDEEIIVNGLYEIFASLGGDQLDLYKAYSGEEAIRWMNRTRFDILLTDIRMPEIDGLQLMETMKQRWPRCRIILLTGHSEFEYVYQAIQYPDVTYILKAEDNEKIIEVVRNAVTEIQKEVQIEDLLHQAKDQMDKTISAFQNDYLNHMLRGDPHARADQEQFRQLGIHMNSRMPVYLAAGKVEPATADASYVQNADRMNGIRQVLIRYLATHANYLIAMDGGYAAAIFVQPRQLHAEDAQPWNSVQQRYEDARAFLQGTLETVEGVCRETLGTPVRFVLSTHPCNWREVCAKYSDLLHISNFHIGVGEESAASNGGEEGGLRDAPQREAAVRLEKRLHAMPPGMLAQLLERGMEKEFFRAMEELLEPLAALESNGNRIGTEAYYAVALPLLSFINRWKLDEKKLLRARPAKLMDIQQFATWTAAAEGLRESARVLFETRKVESASRVNGAITQLQQYIHDHVGEDLSLVRLAELAFMNPSYLSRVYKSETGANLSDFIDRARLARAKELLTGSTMKGYEVARLVGYDAMASFSRFFKRMAGVSPQEYRDAHRR